MLNVNLANKIIGRRRQCPLDNPIEHCNNLLLTTDVASIDVDLSNSMTVGRHFRLRTL